MLYMNLQSIGPVLAVAASTIVPGDYLMWNRGIVVRIISITEISKAFLCWHEVDENGVVAARRISKKKAVCRVVPNGQSWRVESER